MAKLIKLSKGRTSKNGTCIQYSLLEGNQPISVDCECHCSIRNSSNRFVEENKSTKTFIFPRDIRKDEEEEKVVTPLSNSEVPFIEEEPCTSFDLSNF